MRRARSVPGRGLGLQMAEQRTRNTPHISVTREVSQLRSGWLKACAHCRGSQAGHTVRGGLRVRRREVASECGACTVAACRGDCGARGTRGGAARTANVPYMLVTREVSQLSGWLKAIACCRGSQAGHTVRGGLCGPGCGRRAGGAADRGVYALRAGERARVTADIGGGWGGGGGRSARQTWRPCQ